MPVSPSGLWGYAGRRQNCPPNLASSCRGGPSLPDTLLKRGGSRGSGGLPPGLTRLIYNISIPDMKKQIELNHVDRFDSLIVGFPFRCRLLDYTSDTFGSFIWGEYPPKNPFVAILWLKMRPREFSKIYNSLIIIYLLNFLLSEINWAHSGQLFRAR
jgi:hypothetical protein